MNKLVKEVNDYLSNYSSKELKESLQESPDIILEVLTEYAEEAGLDVPVGEFSESMFSAIDSILEQGLDNIGSKLIELIMNPEMYSAPHQSRSKLVSELQRAGVDLKMDLVYLAVAGRRPLSTPKILTQENFANIINKEVSSSESDIFADTDPEMLDLYSTYEYVNGDIIAKAVFNINEVDHIVYQ